MGRKHGALTFRLVQVLSGHGCFGAYLCRIARREPSARCHECGHAEDTAQHTLEFCGHWSDQRAALAAEIGRDLSLPAVVNAMVGSESSWNAVASFCEEVMALKEAAERWREEDAAADPLRRRRDGRRRQAHTRRLPP
ncbi:uncharacterized protein LOC123723336 [Papilio machaon]|uniref:uncharacterized protein LOC123723336 n=1 Tax=Papilio machaon TaxID=76193 RepID=UPI001E664C24|nr:uncharacterized protein LOC123723336 [Papilio machaon]